MDEQSVDQASGTPSGETPVIRPFPGSWIISAVLLSLFALSSHTRSLSDLYERVRHEDALREAGIRVPADVSATTRMEKGEWYFPEHPVYSVAYRFHAPDGREHAREIETDQEMWERFRSAGTGEAVFLPGFPHDSRLLGESAGERIPLYSMLALDAALAASIFVVLFLTRKEGIGKRRASRGSELLITLILLALAAGVGWLSLTPGWYEYRLRRAGAETAGLALSRNNEERPYSVQIAYSVGGVRYIGSYPCAYHVQERYPPGTPARIYFLPDTPGVSGLADNVESHLSVRYLPPLLLVIGMFLVMPLRFLRIVLLNRKVSATGPKN